jgi:ribosomal protein L16 Arg81 hydroxylase
VTLDLAGLIAPVTIDAFLADHWDQVPLVIERNQSDRYTSVLTLEEVLELTASETLTTNQCRLIRDGSELPAAAYASPETQRVDPARLQAEVASGATVVLRGVEHQASGVRRLCRALERALSPRSMPTPTSRLRVSRASRHTSTPMMSSSCR